MTSWIPFSLPSSIQKRFLSYALSQTGLFDDSAVDLDKWNFTWGRRNVVELKDVALSTLGITEKLQLPPCLRVEAARILFLRVMIPADIHRASIECEVDGIEIVTSYHKVSNSKTNPKPARDVTSSSQSPSHRKIHRRIRSPVGRGNRQEDEFIPTVHDLARSFLLEEPAEERQQLEASVAAQTASLDESMISESSDSTELGTGAALGVPAFLAGFLRGVLDRMVVSIQNIDITTRMEVSAKESLASPIQCRLSMGRGRFWTTIDSTTQASSSARATRHFEVHDLAFDLLTHDSDVATASPSTNISNDSRLRHNNLRSANHGLPSTVDPFEFHNRPSDRLQHSDLDQSRLLSRSYSPRGDEADQMDDRDRFADAREEETFRSQAQSDLDIQPGEDNISWGERRTKSGIGSQELWDSVAVEEDLPDSLLFDSRRDQRHANVFTHSNAASQSSFHNAASQQQHDRSQPVSRLIPSPGSWPVLDQSQSIFSQQSQPESLNVSPIDNKRSAIKHSTHQGQVSEMVDDESRLDSPAEALAQSRIFTHGEAKSMYMSAMTQEPHSSPSRTKFSMPGTWQSEIHDTQSLHEHDVQDQTAFRAPAESALLPSLLEDSILATESRPGSGAETPRAQPSSAPNDDMKRNDVAKELICIRLLLVDNILVHLPHSGETPQVAANSESRKDEHIPGSFSTHPKSHMVREISSLSCVDSHEIDKSQSASSTTEHSGCPRIEINSITLQFDTATARTLLQAGKMLQKSLSHVPAARSKPSTASKDLSSFPPFQASINNIDLALMRQIPPVPMHESAEETKLSLSIHFRRLKMDVVQTEICLSTDLSIHIGEKQLLGFEKSTSLKDDGKTRSDLEITYIQSKVHMQNRTVQELLIDGRIIKICFDLPVINATFSEHGGLSGLLELSGSALSESGLGASPVSKRSPGAVRFHDDQHVEDLNQLKINARLVGIHTLLQGQSCAVYLQTASLKAIYREQAISASLSEVHIDAPYLPESTNSNHLSLSNLRLDFLIKPQDRDLEKLVALLTPSKDKYEDDDDILIDILLRQRRKGSCLRVTADELHAKVESWSSLIQLQVLSAELAQAAEVTKYLPEDDRPGLLTMIRVSTLISRMPSNDKMGEVILNLKELQLAHVGLPALLAVSLSDLSLVKMENDCPLLHSLQTLAGTDNLPMIMARIVGGEAEPTIKIKIYNTCAEYSVATLLEILDKPLDTDSGEVMNELVASVAELAFGQTIQDSETHTPPSGNDKQTKIAVLIRHSAIGLTPQKLPSKALFILTDVKISTLVPPTSKFNIATELRRAAIFLTDHAAKSPKDEPAIIRRTSENTATDAHLSSILTKRGYVSIGSIMSAKIDVSVSDVEDGNKAIQVGVLNELMLLETCADSTQTLVATLNGLAPPAPPTKTPKYMTEPLSLQEMMTSFTGEEVERPAASNDMLFDIDHVSDDQSHIDELNSELGESHVDELLAQSDLSTSLYGPVSGLLGVDGDQAEVEEEEEEEDRPLTEAAESLLEEDPFVMTVTPDDLPFSDNALMKDLRQQAKPVSAPDTIDLGEVEFEDLGYDSLGPDMHVLGQRDRFCAPISQQRQIRLDATHFPFKLRLTDGHLIWNIHDGFDWQHTRDDITSAVERVEARAEERFSKRRQSRNDLEDDESVIGDCLFNSIYIGVPSAQEAQDIRRQINRHIDDLASETESVPMSGMSRPSAYSISGRLYAPRTRRRLKLERSRSHKIGFELSGVSADVLVYPEATKELQSAVDLRIKNFEIFDNVPTSTWKKFLTKLKSSDGQSEISRPMMHIELLSVKTIQDFSASELILHVSVLPLRLHVDQDALDFITRFFEFKDESADQPESPGEQPFLQRVEIDTVDLQLDYKPKKVDYAGLRSGHTTEFMNFVILDAANIRLKHAIVYGIKGFEPLHKTLNDVWMPDVRRNQLPTVLAGLAPVRSLVNIGTGVRDVVAIPVREYKKDGRILRSVQKGAYQFGKTTTSELARLGAKMAIGTQNALSSAEGFLSPNTASPTGRPVISRRVSSEHGWHDVETYEDGEREQRAISAYADQPLGVLAGLRSARRFLEHDLLTAKDALIAVQGEIMNSEGPGSAAAAVVRHAPTVILRPVIGATRAVGTALLGVGNQIDADNMRRMEDKYKRR